MSSGATGTDESLSASKIEPLASGTKYGQALDTSSTGGVVGTDSDIDQSRLDPIAGNRGQYQHTEPHADSHGVVGRDETVHGAKIEPLAGELDEATRKDTGLGDEEVDAARVAPLGEVRKEMK